MMKDTYTRQEVIEITNNYAKQIARLQRELDSNVEMFVRLLHESVDLVWEEYSDYLENEESNCSY